MTDQPPPIAGATGAGRPPPVEESLEDLYENAPCGYLSTTPSGVIVKVNDTLLHWTGHTREHLLYRSFDDVLSVGSQLFYETRCLPTLRVRNELNEVALVLRRADGSSLPVLANFSVNRRVDGTPITVRTAVFDASGRQDYERDLLSARREAERSEVRVRVLQQASAAFGTARTEESLMDSLVEAALMAFDATCATVMLFHPTQDTERARDVEPVGLLRAVGETHPVGASVWIDEPRPEALAYRERRVVSIDSIDEAERTFPALAPAMVAARLAALTAIPILEDYSALGVLVCFFGRSREFDDEEVQLKRALARQAAQALQRIRLQAQLQFQALHDQLTGLANRELLHRRLAQALAAAARHQRPIALFFLDLDGFKAINDQLGHLAGDAVLVEVARRIRPVVRLSDTVARFGGDEFVVLCEDIDSSGALRVAERLRAVVRQPCAGVAGGFALTASVGVAVHDPDGTPGPEAATLVEQADAAMYRSKANGKDRETVIHI